MDEITTEEFAEQTGLSIEDFVFTMRLANSIMSEDFNWGEAIQTASKLNLSKLQLVIVGVVFGRTMQASICSSRCSAGNANPELS